MEEERERKRKRSRFNGSPYTEDNDLDGILNIYNKRKDAKEIQWEGSKIVRVVISSV